MKDDSSERESVGIRAAESRDLPELQRIYTHWIKTSAATFDLVPKEEQALVAWFETFDSSGPHRLLVCDNAEGGLLGFASSAQLRQKAAFATSVELSVYLDPNARGRGVGTLLLARLLSELESENVHRAYAALTVPNPASERLVRAAGFEQVGLFREVGFKAGRYWDVAWYERAIPL